MLITSTPNPNSSNHICQLMRLPAAGLEVSGTTDVDADALRGQDLEHNRVADLQLLQTST
jgi:hypothetical protein